MFKLFNIVKHDRTHPYGLDESRNRKLPDKVIKITASLKFLKN